MGLTIDQEISIPLGARDRRASGRPSDAMPLKPFPHTTHEPDLRRVSQDLETFAYSARHALQEPLRTIAISAQLLKLHRGDRLHPDEADFLARIVIEADQMLGLLRNLQAYADAIRYAQGTAPAINSTERHPGDLENTHAGNRVILTSASLLPDFDPQNTPAPRLPEPDLEGRSV
jgi:signal transduction histidine kinase